jgi:hypothetical protein
VVTVSNHERQTPLILFNLGPSFLLFDPHDAAKTEMTG